MSDLACPATLLVTRHARATFVEDVFSDEGGSLTSEGRQQAAALGDALATRRLAAIWCSDTSRAVQTAEIVAARTGVAVTVRKALREVYVGSLTGTPFDLAALEGLASRWAAGDLSTAIDGGESGAEVIARHREVFEEIADQYRGETVLVVGHQIALGVAVPALAGRDPARAAAVIEEGLDHVDTVELRRDADGWVLLDPPHP